MALILTRYLERKTVEEYGIGVGTKVVLMLRMMNNVRTIPTGSHFMEHLGMATQIMRVPRSTRSFVVECGCYAGGTTANRSLVCKEWWRENIPLNPPGMAGAGSNLGIIPGRRGFRSVLVFTLTNLEHSNREYRAP
jgi:hypothetical protein